MQQSVREIVDSKLDRIEARIITLEQEFSTVKAIAILGDIASMKYNYTVAKWWIDEQRTRVQNILDRHQDQLCDDELVCDFITPVKTGSPMIWKNMYIVNMD